MDIFQNELDFERTLQSTERTFLAYIRTSLTVFVVGISLIKFFDAGFLTILGWVFIPISIIILLFGLRHYRTITQHIFRIKRKNGNLAKSSASAPRRI